MLCLEISFPSASKFHDWSILPRLSVVIPTIRVDDFLDQAIDSVLQDNNLDLELLVYHDGVKPDLSRSWTADTRVKILNGAKRIGQTKGMNILISEASGTYVARLDADDISYPERLSLQLKFLDENPDAVAIGASVQRIDEKNVPLGPLIFPSGKDVRRHLILQNVIPHSTLMFRKEIVSKIGGYDEKLSQMEDYVFILKLATEGDIASLKQPLVGYRIHSGQISRGAKPYGSHIRAVLLGRKKLAKKIGISFLEIWLKNSIWVLVQYLRYFQIRKPGYDRF